MADAHDVTAIQEAALSAVFDTLLAATEAAVWVVVEASPQRVLDPPRLNLEPARDLVEATHRVVTVADQLVAAVRRYRVLRALDEEHRRQQPLPFE